MLENAMIMCLMMSKPEEPHEIVSVSVVLNSLASPGGQCWEIPLK